MMIRFADPKKDAELIVCPEDGGVADEVVVAG